MEDEQTYLFLLRQSQNKGFIHCAAQTVLEATKFCGSLPGNRFLQYKLKLQFLQQGKIVEMLASCMDYDIEKFRKACIDELDKQFFYTKQRNTF